jgi:hypothetical protein
VTTDEDGLVGGGILELGKHAFERRYILELEVPSTLQEPTWELVQTDRPRLDS